MHAYCQAACWNLDVVAALLVYLRFSRSHHRNSITCVAWSFVFCISQQNVWCWRDSRHYCKYPLSIYPFFMYITSRKSVPIARRPALSIFGAHCTRPPENIVLTTITLGLRSGNSECIQRRPRSRFQDPRQTAAETRRSTSTDTGRVTRGRRG